MADGVNITHNDIDITLKEMKKEMPNVERSMLLGGAYVIKEKAKEDFVRKLPAATKQNAKYSDTLVDAVRMGKIDGGTITIHTLGSRESTSGTYRARFFEGGTRDRYQKTRNGKRLKKKKFIGKISPLGFFGTAVQTMQEPAFQKMQTILDNYIESKNNG
jgi:hypothetical protein